MADVRLITILPGSQVQGIQQSPQGAGSQILAALSNLHPGTVLSGFIINRDAGGNPVLRTEQGDVTFQSNFFLKIGSEVVIRIEQQAKNTLAHILTVNGQPPEVAEKQSSFATTPDVIVSKNLTGTSGNTSTQQTTSQASSSSSASAPSITAQTASPAPTANSTKTGTIFTGTIISTPPASAPQAPPNGTAITVKVIDLQLAPPASPQSIPSPSNTIPVSPSVTASYAAYGKTSVTNPASVVPPAGATTPAPPIQTATTTAQAPATSSVRVSNQPVTLPPASTPATPATTSSTLPVSSSQTTGAPTTTAPVLPTSVPVQTIVPTPAVGNPIQSGQTIIATVIANEPTGDVLLQSPAGIIRLPVSNAPPLNAQITLEITSLSLPAAQLVPASSEPAALPELARHWNSLQQIFSLLAGNSSLDFLEAKLPWIITPQGESRQSLFSPQNIPSGIMLFITALRGGDFRNWLGNDAVKWLEDNGHDTLLKKAEGEFSSLARQFTAPPTQQPWQSLFFPIAVAGNVQQIKLFVKRDKDKKDGNQADRKSDDTRFIVEIDLTQLGEMQMDGFVRRTEKQTQFDLIIRSHMALETHVQQNILQIYNDTGELTGYKGSIVFQSVKEFPVNPMKENVAHAMGEVIV